MLFACLAIILSAQTDRALLIAIDSYPSGSGWTKIHAENDISIVLPMLLEKGYKRENIKTLINERATKNAIVHALENICEESTSGDYIYIHFSCHGQQMADDNGDEPDGLDEALIPYDAQRWYKKDVYEGENHLRDDEFEILLNNIRKKIGSKGNVFVVLDACHSGTADRDTDDDAYIRGTTYIFAPGNYKPTAINTNKKPSLRKGKRLSQIAIFSACQPDQINYEYKSVKDNTYYGSLSYAFCEVMNNISEDILINELFNKLKYRMELMFINKLRKQNPYFESTDLNEKIRIAR
jgi:hypothetical protein